MGKVKPKLSGESRQEIAKPSLKTIVKPKEKLKVTPVVPVKVKETGDFPKRPALKRKQKQKAKAKQKNTEPSSPKVHQKKHVKLAEKKKKLALKFELMLKEQKEAKKQEKVEKANKKIGSVATLGAIKDALPSLESLMKFKGKEIKTGIPEYDSIKVQKKGKGKKDKRKENNKLAIKEKRIQKESQEISKRYDYLQKLMSDPTFKKNPRQVIAEHIKNTKLEEAQEK